MTADSVAARCSFRTERLDVGNWRHLAEAQGLALVAVVMRLLTAATTASLPPEWHGAYDAERARGWIAARDAESPTLLALDVASGAPVGLVILFELPDPERPDIDLRLGYLIAEDAWGQGYGTELVQGLVRWAQEASVGSITGGVARENAASAAVLMKAGFSLVGDSEGGEQLFEYRFDRIR